MSSAPTSVSNLSIGERITLFLHHPTYVVGIYTRQSLPSYDFRRALWRRAIIAKLRWNVAVTNCDSDDVHTARLRWFWAAARGRRTVGTAWTGRPEWSFGSHLECGNLAGDLREYRRETLAVAFPRISFMEWGKFFKNMVLRRGFQTKLNTFHNRKKLHFSNKSFANSWFLNILLPFMMKQSNCVFLFLGLEGVRTSPRYATGCCAFVDGYIYFHRQLLERLRENPSK